MGGIGGPLIGGILIGAGFAVTQIFLILTGVALLGLVLVLMVPRHHRHAVPHTISPSAPGDRYRLRRPFLIESHANPLPVGPTVRPVLVVRPQPGNDSLAAAGSFAACPSCAQPQ